jgi:plastocyanin
MTAIGIGAGVLIAAGCSSSGSKATTPTAAAPGAASTTAGSSAPSGAHTAAVLETEFRIGLSTTSFTAGTWSFAVINNGKIVHSLEVDGPGVHAVTPVLQPGQSATLKATLQPGHYDVFCPIPGHKALGMNAEITVAGGGGAATNSASATPTGTPTPTAMPATTVGGAAGVS